MRFNTTSCSKLSREKKRELVATAGKVVTEKQNTPLCVTCAKTVRNIVRCTNCSCGLYCSERCATQNIPEHEILCEAIQSIEKLEQEKRDRNHKDLEFRNKLPSKLNKEIVRLVGERPLLDVRLDNIVCKCLWDTGSMVSVISKIFLAETFPNKVVYSVEEFLGEKSLSLSAANNTEVPVEGVVLLDFGGDEYMFQIPFLVTKENIAHTILGYNAIEYLVLNLNEECKVPALMKILPDLSVDETKIIISTIEKASEVSEILGDVRSVMPQQTARTILMRRKRLSIRFISTILCIQSCTLLVHLCLCIHI